MFLFCSKSNVEIFRLKNFPALRADVFLPTIIRNNDFGDFTAAAGEKFGLVCLSIAISLCFFMVSVFFTLGLNVEFFEIIPHCPIAMWKKRKNPH